MKRHIFTVIVLTALFSSTLLKASEPNNVVAWGYNEYGQCNGPEPPCQIFIDKNAVS